MSKKESSLIPAGILQCNPPNVHFTLSQVGAVQSAVVKIKNIDIKGRVIRFRAPKSKYFSVRDLQPTIRLAPGFETYIEVLFHGDDFKKDQTCNDKVLLQSEVGVYELHLSAAFGNYDVVIDGDLSFGALPIDTKSTKKFRLRNRGTAPATYTLDWDRALPVVVEPIAGILAAEGNEGSCVEVSVIVTVPEGSGLFGDILIALGEADVRRVTYNASILRQSFELMDSFGVKIQELDFGPTYFGEMLERRFEVFNNGPFTSRFLLSNGATQEVKSQVTETNGPPADQGSGDQSDVYYGFVMAAHNKVKAREFGENPFSVTPLSGEIPPFTKKLFIVSFHPTEIHSTEAKKGFSSTMPRVETTSRHYDHLVTVELIGTPTKLKVPLRGRGMPSGIRLTPTRLSFGDVASHDYADQTFVMANTNPVLDMKFDIGIETAPYFEVNPHMGLIHAGQSMQLMARYQPRALGQHSNTLPIKLTSNQGTLVAEMQLALSGCSRQIGTKPSLVGGPDKLPTDFIKAPKYIDENQVAESMRRPKLRHLHSLANFLERPDIAGAFDDIGDKGTRHSFSKAEYLSMKEMHEKYTLATRTQRLTKSYELRNQKLDEIDVNIGLKSRSGMKEPEPCLPRIVEPLWTVENGKEAKPRYRKVLADKDLEAGPTLFKPRPETEVERIACSKELTDDQISKLVVGPKVIQFGSISVGASITRFLYVTNTLDVPIHVVIDLKSVSELRMSPNSSQVIPTGLTARFPLVLVGKDVHSVSQKLEFCINSAHILDVEVAALVSPVSLEMSTEELFFEFNLDNWEPYVDKPLVLDNPHKFPVELETEINNTIFSVTPASVTVKPDSSSELMVRWHPTPDSAPGIHTGNMLLKLVGGDAPRRVYLRAEVPEGALRFREKALDAGTVAVGVPQLLIAQLRNAGQRDAAFRVLPNDAVTVKPQRAKVSAGATVDLEISFTCLDVCSLSTVVEVDIRGGSTIGLPVKAEAITPIIETMELEFPFGSIYTGGIARLPVTLSNTTPVPAMLLIDLVNYPEFELTLSKDAWSVSEYEACPLVRMSPGEANRPNSRRTGVATSSATIRKNPSNVANAANVGSKYQVSLNPRKSLPLMLEFRPTAAASHNFDMEFLTLGASEKHSQKMQRTVRAEGVAPRIVMSASEHDFGSCVVIRSNQTKAPYQQAITFTNRDAEPVTVVFAMASRGPGSEADLGLSAFAMRPSHLVLQPGDQSEAAIRFTPRDSRSYAATIAVHLLDGVVSPPPHVSELANAEPYFRVEVTGSGRHPRLACNVREVILPPVPLGIRSEATFYVVNSGYDNLEIEFRLHPDEAHLPLVLEFPEGRLIGLAKSQLPVVVSFTHSKPLSFTTSIDFLDEDGKRYSVPVTGATDNCLLTYQAFLKANIGELQIKAEDKSPIRLLEATYNLPTASAALGPLITSPGICRLLNLAGLGRGEPLQHLTGELMRSRGKLLVELVETLAGKNLVGKLPKLSPNKKEAAKQLLAFFDTALINLKSQGALLNQVKPEMLLDLEDFGRILSEREAAATTPEDEDALGMWTDVEKDFKMISQQAWNSVVLQVVKVFVLCRVTWKTYRNLPGIDRLAANLQAESAVVGSNLYSVAEGTLLSWLTAHYAREYPKLFKRITNFDLDLRDGLALFSVLSGYWPAVGRKRAAMKTSVAIERDLLENADSVCRMIQELGLLWEVTPQDILNPDPCEMVVLVLYLYQTLPQFIPRTTITFNCKLGDVMVKELELTNPSKNLISYAARIEGHKDFTLDGTVFTIEPRGNLKMKIKCAPSTSMPQESRIVLISRKESGSNAATLVFSLKSSINIRSPLKRVFTEGPLYEAQQFEFTITNPYPSDCELFLTLLHEPAEPVAPVKVEEDNRRRSRTSPGSPRLKHSSQRESAASYTDMMSSAQMAYTTAANPSAARAYPAAFGLEKLRLRLKQGKSEKVKGVFLPFIMGTQHCTVMMKDKDYGEFCYELVGEVGLPAPFMEAQGFVAHEGQQAFDLPIPFLNHQLDTARRIFMDRHPSAKDKDQLALVKAEQKQFDVTYQVLQSNNLVHCADTLNLTAHGLGSTGEGRPPEDPSVPPETNTLRLLLKPVGIGHYPIRILMASAIDTRVISLTLTAQQLVQTFSMDFNCPARQAIVQNVPIVNHSDTALVVSASLTGSRIFSGPRDLTVPAMGTLAYPLRFSPTTPGNHRGSLDLTMSGTGERNVYTLTGTATEPLAEGHIVIDCVARANTTRRIAVPSIAGSATEYTIMSDLACISGPDKLKAQPGTASTYTLTACPQRSGTHVGMIAFQADDGNSCWFVVEVRATEPPEFGTVEVEAQVRGAVEVEVNLVNPTNKPLELAVRYSHPALIGPKKFNMAAGEPGAQQPFTFYFAPLFPGTLEGHVVLVNEEAGEYVYVVKGTALPADTNELPPLSVELGQRGSLAIPMDNLLDSRVAVTATCSNPQLFQITPKEADVPAQGSFNFQVEYMPNKETSAEEPDTAIITLEGAELGTFTYGVTGHGVAPAPQHPLHINTQIGQVHRETLTWTNPFDSVVDVQVTLTPGPEMTPGVFELIPGLEGLQPVAPKGVLLIPVVFSPQSLSLSNADVEVRARDVLWRYPVIGVAEASKQEGIFKYRCRARNQVQEVMEVVLAGLHSVSPEDEFTTELIIAPEHRTSLAGALSITPVDGGTSSRLAAPTDPLRYRVTFTPQRVFNASADFLVVKSTGGKWKFEIQLTATEPDSIGTIVIEAAMGQSVSRPIHLYSLDSTPQPFTAQFTPETALSFSVTPAKGVLPVKPDDPREQAEPAFTVTYTCRDLGKVLKGKLIISTADTQYCYEVKGKVPDYVPPVLSNVPKTVDNELPKELQPKPPNRNFVAKNIQTLTRSQRNLNVQVSKK